LPWNLHSLRPPATRTSGRRCSRSTLGCSENSRDSRDVNAPAVCLPQSYYPFRELPAHDAAALETMQARPPRRQRASHEVPSPPALEGRGGFHGRACLTRPSGACRVSHPLDALSSATNRPALFHAGSARGVCPSELSPLRQPFHLSVADALLALSHCLLLRRPISSPLFHQKRAARSLRLHPHVTGKPLATPEGVTFSTPRRRFIQPTSRAVHLQCQRTASTGPSSGLADNGSAFKALIRLRVRCNHAAD
jgi:hypothetical protein